MTSRADAAGVEDVEPRRGDERECTVRFGQRGSDVAIVGRYGAGGIALAAGGADGFLRGANLGFVTLIIGALFERCAQGLLLGDGGQRRKRHGFGDVEILAGRQSDDAAQRELVLCELVFLRNQALLLLLQLHLRSQNVDSGRRSGPPLIGGAIVERLRGLHLGADGVGSRGVGDDLQIRSGHCLHYQVARILRRKTRGAFVFVEQTDSSFCAE